VAWSGQAKTFPTRREFRPYWQNLGCAKAKPLVDVGLYLGFAGKGPEDQQALRYVGIADPELPRMNHATAYVRSRLYIIVHSN
jgi:hypothetical protein